MAIAFDSAGSTSSASNVASLETAAWSISGVNRFLVAGAGSGAGSPANVSAVKWDGSGGTDLSLLGSHVNLGSFGRVSQWTLVAPATGSHTLYAAWASNQDETALGGASYTGVHQSTPMGTQATANTGGTDTPTVNASSATGELVVDTVFALNTNGDISGLAAGGGQTARVDVDAVGGGAFECFGMSEEAGAGTVTMSWTVTTPTGNNTDWGILAVPLKPASAGGPFDLAPTSGIALHGTVGLTGDVNADAPVVVDVVPTSGIALAGRLAATGNVGVRTSWEFETPLQVRQMSGVLQVTGDIGFILPFDVAPLSAISLHGLLATTGDIATLVSFDVAPLSAVSLHGMLAVTGDLAAPTPFNVAPLSAVALHGMLAVTGDVEVPAGGPFDVAPLTAVALHGMLAATGDVAAPVSFNVAPLSTVTLHGMLATAGDIAAPVSFNVAPLAAVSLHGRLAVTGGIDALTPFNVAPLAAVSLHGRLAAAGDVRAGSPFDLAAGGIALRGSLSIAGEIASSDTPPAPPPAATTDPLSAKFLARRKRPNIRMRWGSGKEPEPPAAPAPSEPAPRPPRLARGLDLEVLPEPTAPAQVPPSAAPAAPVAPAASAPSAPPAAPVAPSVALPPDLTAEVAALRAAHASLQQEMQQAAAQAVQRAADIYTALQQQTAHLERELAQAQSEIAALRAKIERDARNRRRAEEIARKLLGDK